MTTSIYSEIEIEHRTFCDFCDCELPRGIDAVEDASTGDVYCSMVCWEDARAIKSESSDKTVVDK